MVIDCADPVSKKRVDKYKKPDDVFNHSKGYDWVDLKTIGEWLRHNFKE